MLFHHFLLDEVTRRHGPPGNKVTTVRNCHDLHDSRSTALKLRLKFYAYYQFCALASQLLPHARLGDLGYNSLVAVQSQAFLMTLIRKGIIKWYTHAAVYTLALVMSMGGIWINFEPTFFFAKVAFMFYLRVNFERLSKYLIWTLFVIISLPDVENFLF
jgi:hypothetical protein